MKALLTLAALANKVAGIIDKWIDEHLRNKYRKLGQQEGAAIAAKENNLAVQAQLDSAAQIAAENAAKTQEEIDAIITQGIKR